MHCNNILDYSRFENLWEHKIIQIPLSITWELMKKTVKDCMGNVVISLIGDLDLKEILNVTIRFELYQFGSSLEKENFNDIVLKLRYNNILYFLFVLIIYYF